MKGLAVCTAVAANYLPFARVLADSFLKYHPEIPFFVLVGDPQASPGRDKVRVLRLEELRIASLRRMLIEYDRKQVMVAAKPAVLRYLLEEGHDSALFLDPDMLVTAPLDPALEVVQRHSLTLTPHLFFGPEGESDERRERALLYAGLYNGGFVGASRCEQTLRFLRWWEGRLRTHCMEAVRLGLHFDQRWLDLAPGYVEDLRLLRDRGVNAAYWNVSGREVKRTEQGLTINGEPLRLFHMSGYSPERPQQVTRHQAEMLVEELGELAGVYREYGRLLKEAGWAEESGAPWAWDGWRRQWRRIVAQWRRVRPYRPF